MKENTKTTNQTTESFSETQVLPSSQVGQDLRNSVLIVSIVANLFILTAWIALQVTTQFDAQLAAALFNR